MLVAYDYNRYQNIMGEKRRSRVEGEDLVDFFLQEIGFIAIQFRDNTDALRLKGLVGYSILWADFQNRCVYFSLSAY